jgi:hypothetical protein
VGLAVQCCAVSSPSDTPLAVDGEDAVGDREPTAAVGRRIPGTGDVQAPRVVWLGCLAFAVWLPSVGTTSKYTGAAGVVLHLLAAAVGVVILDRLVAPIVLRRLPARAVTVLLVGLAVVVVVLFAAVHQRADDTAPGSGSDRDEAIDVAIDQLLDGEYPYRSHTYLDNPITSMPALLLVSAPFAIVAGTSAVQNLFWAVAGIALAVAWFRDQRRALLACGVMGALCVGFWQEHVTGGDLVASSIVVTATVLWSRHRLLNRPTQAAAVLCGLVLGVALATRLNAGLLVAPVLAVAWFAGRRREAVLTGGVAAAVAGGLTLPFYLADRDDFSPLTAVTKLTEVGEVLPGAAVLIPAIGALLAVVLALWVAPRGDCGFLVACAVPQIAMVAPVIPLLALDHRAGGPYAIYGLGFAWFLALTAIVGLYGGREPAAS